MGEGFDFAVVGMQGRLDDVFAVARRQGAGNPGPFRHGLAEAAHLADDDIQRFALVAAVIRVENLFIFADGHDLRRRGTSVDAQIQRAAVGGEVAPFHPVLVVTGHKGVIFRFAAEQGQPFVADDAVAALGLVKVLHQVFVAHPARLIGQRAADGHEIGAVLHVHHVFRCQFQGLDKAFLQFRQKGQGPAEEGHVALDFASLGQVADGLVHDGLEDGLGDILPRSAVVHEGLDIRFGEYAAAAGDGIDALGLGRQVVQSLGVRIQQGRHLVDEGPRAAGADAVHAFFRRRPEVHDLGVFPAQFHHGICLGNQFPDSRRRRNDFLHKGQFQALGDAHAGRPGQGEAETLPSHDVLQCLQTGRQRMGNVGEMPPVRLVEDTAGFIQHHRLNRRRTDIDSDFQIIGHVNTSSI